MTKRWRIATVLLAVATALPMGASLRAEDQKPAAAAPADANCPRATFRVVIDVGHTIDVPGALSARGMPEYAFNLQLGKNIKQALNDAGFDKTTLLITGKAPPMGLVERAVIANRIPADLFSRSITTRCRTI
jgi:N-acetylmuramoyl-L-alanine amidase